jgi:hypothetical protein
LSDDTTRDGPHEPATAGSDSTGAPIDFTFGRDLIIDASVTMVTPDIGRAADDVIDIARRNSGAVFNANVTDRLIDLDIQIRQALESVERMEALLGETTEFDALVAAEIQLSQRQIADERLLAAKRNVDDRVALSTLTVNLEYQAPNQSPSTLLTRAWLVHSATAGSPRAASAGLIQSPSTTTNP